MATAEHVPPPSPFAANVRSALERYKPRVLIDVTARTPTPTDLPVTVLSTRRAPDWTGREDASLPDSVATFAESLETFDLELSIDNFARRYFRQALVAGDSHERLVSALRLWVVISDVREQVAR